MAINKKTKQQKSKHLKELRHRNLDVNVLFDGLKRGKESALAKAITLIESTKADDFIPAQELVTRCLQVNNSSIRLGITGVPGVGKSTFIEAFGTYLTGLGKKVAVLAVDPSSTLTKGSILGDKTRMEKLAKDPNAFIRPSPAQETLGGVARKTREAIILCEAAGFDIILVETVGVGQSETIVHSMVDFFLLLKLAGAGDELQGLKRGVMEMADSIVINKADGENIKSAKLAVTEFKRALHLYPAKSNGWIPEVLSCSSIEDSGINIIWETITKFIELTKNNNHFQTNRIKQNQNWFLQTVEQQLKKEFFDRVEIKEGVTNYLGQIEENKISPAAAAQELFKIANE